MLFAGMGSISDTVSKVLKDTAIYCILFWIYICILSVSLDTQLRKG